MKHFLIYLTTIAVLGVACKKENVATVIGKGNIPLGNTVTTLYTVKKGNHYCDQTRVEMTTRSSISAYVTFDSSAIYTSTIAENQWDVNKLIGFSDCGTDHQENSARLGWSWDGNALVIYAYAYNNKQRIIKTLGTAPLNLPFSCSVKAEKGQYYFTLNNVTDSIPRHCADYSGSRYKLFPYFGGDEVAPHDVKVEIEERDL